MPMVEQSPVHHHTYSPKTYYHDERIPDQTSAKIQLTLILPNGVPSVISVDANTPMMDLLVQAASLNKLNPSGYSLVVLDSNQHVIHFKANQTVGQIVKSCHLPQINGSSTISLLPKEPIHPNPSSSKSKAQPFEITVRLQVNLPDAQKILLRVDPTLPLHEIKEQICKQKKYTHSNEYTFRLPSKLDQPLALGLSLAECKTNELTLVHNQQIDYDEQLNRNEIQSFDRLYRARSESQPPNEAFQETQNQQLHPSRSSTLRPSHTSLHAYWNDPNFDTQSQISNCSSMAKKRRAPKAPGCSLPMRSEPQIVYVPQQQSPSEPLRLDHHQSQESLQSENTKKKRKAPVVLLKKEPETITESHIARPTVEPPPPPSPDLTNTDSSLTTPIQENPSETPVEEESETPTPINVKLSIMTDSLEVSNSTSQSPLSNQSAEPIQSESIQLTPPPVEQPVEIKISPIPTPTIIEFPIAKPPRQNQQKEKKPSTIDSLIRVVDEHSKRPTIPLNDTKQTNENISYFRVAKSRFGKFETDSQGFVHSSIAIFDSTNQPKLDEQTVRPSQIKSVAINSIPAKPQPHPAAQQTKGKQAYNLLKKYEKDDQVQENHFKTRTEKEKSPTPPVQLEMTVETTRTSPVPPPPPIVPPKPSSKIITEHRTVRRSGGETTLKRQEILSSVDNKKRSSSNSSSSHDELMEAIRRFGGSQNLGKN